MAKLQISWELLRDRLSLPPETSLGGVEFSDTFDVILIIGHPDIKRSIGPLPTIRAKYELRPIEDGRPINEIIFEGWQQ